MTLEEIKKLRESEDNVEFKAASGGSISYNGGNKSDYKDRRKCILGYIVAFANEGGGKLILGVHDKYPHKIVGTQQFLNGIGVLESDIYRDLKIRVEISELYEEEKRVVVIEIPGRPIGKVFKFEDIALMRVGEELHPMNDEKLLSILQEQEFDFSEQLCDGLTISDLSKAAIDKMKEAYARKNNNPQFLTLSDEQVLNDLYLSRGNKITNAALILLGKDDIIKEKLPQCAVSVEYRNALSRITFDNRTIFQGPFFLISDAIWNLINSRNGSINVQEGVYIFQIPYFNSEVIREALNNAVSHRE